MSSITITVREPQVAQTHAPLREPEVAMNSNCAGSWRAPLSPGYRHDQTRAPALELSGDGAIAELSPLDGV